MGKEASHAKHSWDPIYGVFRLDFQQILRVKEKEGPLQSIDEVLYCYSEDTGAALEEGRDSLSLFFYLPITFSSSLFLTLSLCLVFSVAPKHMT